MKAIFRRYIPIGVVALALALVVVNAYSVLSEAAITKSMCAQSWQVAEALYERGLEPVAKWRPSGVEHFVVIWAEPFDSDDPMRSRAMTKVLLSAQTSSKACTGGSGDAFELIQ